MLSPRTQALAQQASPQTEDDLFKQGFQELALSQGMSQLPFLADFIVSFKTLDLDIENGTASGTLVCDYEGNELHVPVVLSNGQIQPMDLFYVKGLDIMLPLSERWVSEVSSLSTESMGSAVKPPKNLLGDTDIRNIMVPPSTGRYSYASHTGTPHLLNYLHSGSNFAKTAFLKTLKRYPHIAKHAFEVYGRDNLISVLKHHDPPAVKQASAVINTEVFGPDTPVESLKRTFQDRTPEAMRSISLSGFAYVDDRDPKTLNKLVAQESSLQLETPTTTGFYRIFFNDGTMPIAFVGCKVTTLGPGPYCSDEAGIMKLVVLEDGKHLMTTKPFLAAMVKHDEIPDKFSALFNSRDPRTPRNNQRGFFARAGGGQLECVEPIRIIKVYAHQSGHTFHAHSYCGYSGAIVQSNDRDYSNVRVFGGGRHHNVFARFSYTTNDSSDDMRTSSDMLTGCDTAIMPHSFKFVPLASTVTDLSPMCDEKPIMAMFFDAFRLSGAPIVKLRNAGGGQTYVNDAEMDETEAIQKVATEYGVSVKDAARFVRSADTYTNKYAFVLDRTDQDAVAQRLKYAMEGQDPAMMDPAMMDPAMMDPAMLDPAMMAPPMPPPPSPTEIAAQEVMQQLTQNHQMVQQQMMTQQQQLELQLQAIQAVTARAAQLSGMPMDPAMGGGMPMDPAMGGGMPMDPAMGGGMPMDPAMGMDPSMGMATEEPMSMEAAMNLQDPDLFDAAALTSLGNNAELAQSLSAYLPVFQECLDKLARLLLEMRMQAAKYREAYGDQAYQSITEQLSDTMEALGTALLDIADVTEEHV